MANSFLLDLPLLCWTDAPWRPNFTSPIKRLKMHIKFQMHIHIKYFSFSILSFDTISHTSDTSFFHIGWQKTFFLTFSFKEKGKDAHLVLISKRKWNKFMVYPFQLLEYTEYRLYRVRNKYNTKIIFVLVCYIIPLLVLAWKLLLVMSGIVRIFVCTFPSPGTLWLCHTTT